jgi:hypothetical protein
LLASREIAAARVVMRPSIAASCPGTNSWETTRKCIARFGKVTDIRTRRDMHLVRVEPRSGVWGVGGMYLYALNKGNWTIGGMELGDKFRDIDIQRFTVHKHALWRIDYNFVGTDEISTDGQSSRMARLRSKHSLFCSGQSAMCASIMTSCDVFVGGKTLWTFRGTLEFGEDGSVNVRGDRSHAGELCVQAETDFIPVVGEAE